MARKIKAKSFSFVNATMSDVEKSNGNLYHKKLRDSLGNPVKIRPSGMFIAYKRNPERNYRPYKHGLYESYRVTADNVGEWATAYDEIDDTPQTRITI